MSIQKRGKTWTVRWYVGGVKGTPQQARTFDTKGDAQDFEAALRRARGMGAYAPKEPSALLLADWVTEWTDRDGALWARSTQLQRLGIIRRWITPLLGRTRLRDLGPAEVRAWRSKVLARSRSTNTANAALAVLSACLGAACADGLIPENPCRGTRKLPHLVARPRALTPLECERIRAALPTPADRALWGLMVYGGLRPGEALAVTWDDLRGDTLVVDKSVVEGELRATKTHRRRVVPVIRSLARDLERARSSDARGMTVGGVSDIRNWNRRTFTPAREAAGVEATPYDGRQTYASLMLGCGENPLVVAAALGHGTDVLFSLYGHVLADVRPGTSVTETVERARRQVRRLKAVE